MKTYNLSKFTNGIIICAEINNYVELKFYKHADKTRWKASNLFQA